MVKEGEDMVLQINCEQYSRVPSLEDDQVTMAKAIDILTSEPNATKIIFQQKRNYEYDYNQVALLKEIAVLHNHLIKNKDILSYNALSVSKCTKCIPGWYAEIKDLISSTLKSDPITAYVELKRFARRESIKLDISLFFIR
jgi:hypothetical protein